MSCVSTDISSIDSENSRYIETRVIEVAHKLSTAADNLFASLPKPVRAPGDLIHGLGLPKDAASRLLSALAKRDSLAMLCAMPGAETLYKVGKAARGKTSNARAVDEWNAAVEAFDAFLANEVGGKHALDAIASAWLPEARAKFETANRQSVCKGNGNLRGMIAQVGIQTSILTPNPDGKTVDNVYVTGYTNLRRLRPGRSINLASQRRRKREDPPIGSEIDKLQEPEFPQLMEQFCSKPLPSIKITQVGDYAVCQLEGNSVGMAASCDLFISHFAPALCPRWGAHPGFMANASIRLDVPCERLIFDTLLHEDVWAKSEPEMRLYEILLRGSAGPNDPSFEPYRLDLLESVHSLGRGITPCRVAEVVAYQGVLRHVCETRGYDPGSFRCFRCDSQYPLFGVQYCMMFEMPMRPNP